MKVKVIDPKGVRYNGKDYKKGETFDALGAQLKAFRHFKQVEPANKGEQFGDFKGDANQIPAPVSPKEAAEAKAKADTERRQKAAQQLADAIETRRKELKALKRPEQDQVAEALNIEVPAKTREDDLIQLILDAEFPQNKGAVKD